MTLHSCHTGAGLGVCPQREKPKQKYEKHSPNVYVLDITKSPDYIKSFSLTIKLKVITKIKKKITNQTLLHPVKEGGHTHTHGFENGEIALHKCGTAVPPQTSAASAPRRPSHACAGSALHNVFPQHSEVWGVLATPDAGTRVALPARRRRTAGERELAVGYLAPHQFSSILGEGSRSTRHNGEAQYSKTDKNGAMTTSHSEVRFTEGTVPPVP